MTQLIRSILPSPRRPISFVHPDVSVLKSVNIMVGENIGALVVQTDENILGIASERDIVRELVNKGLCPDNTKISEVMCSSINILDLSDSVEHAMEVITSTKRRHLLGREGEEIVAIISIGDLLFHLLEDRLYTIKQLENYIYTH